jgi:hypothetical protein
MKPYCSSSGSSSASLAAAAARTRVSGSSDGAGWPTPKFTQTSDVGTEYWPYWMGADMAGARGGLVLQMSRRTARAQCAYHDAEMNENHSENEQK